MTDDTLDDAVPAIAEEADGQLAIDVGKKRKGGAWKLPALSLLAPCRTSTGGVTPLAPCRKD